MRTQGVARWFLLATMAAAQAAGGCGRVTADGATGEVQVALTNVPADVNCVRVVADGSRQVVGDMDVQPGQPTTFRMGGLPVGSVSFSARAFSTGCAAVTAQAIPGWVSAAPDVVDVSADEVAMVALQIRRNGQAAVSIDFEHDDAGAPPDGGGAADATPRPDMGRARFTIAVARVGTGSGTVVSTGSAAIDCGVTCAAELDAGTIVTFTATAGAGSSFAGWGGACMGSGAACMVTMDAAKTVEATFTLNQYELAVTKAGTGQAQGAVTAAGGIDCGAACTAVYSHGTTVTLTAAPTPASSVFVGWSGACTGTAPTCTVVMDQARAVTATFDAIAPQVSGVTPAAGATSVSTTATVRATFSRDMDPGSFTSAVFVNGASVSSPYDITTRSITINHATFAFGATITVTISAVARDAQGTPLAQPFTWSFSTVPDTTAPTITAVTPIDGARMVSRSFSPLRVTFSEAMDPATINPTTVTIAGVTGTVAYDAATRSATFTPAAAFGPAQTATLTVATGARDLAGNPLASPFTATFRTARPGLRLNAQTPSPMTNGLVAVKPSTGEAMTVWIADTGTGAKLLWSRWTGSAWSAEQTLDVAVGGTLYPFGLVSTSTGFALLVRKTDDIAGTSKLFGATFDSSWSTTDLTSSPSTVRLVAGTTGAMAIYSTSAGVSARVLSGGVWTAAQAVSGDGGIWDAVGVGGRFVVVGRKGTGLEARVWDGAWSAGETINSATDGAVGGVRLTSNADSAAAAWIYTSATLPAMTFVHVRTLAAAGWTADVTLASSASPASTLLGASHATGHAFAWTQAGIKAAVGTGTSWPSSAALASDGTLATLAGSDTGFALVWTSGTSALVSTFAGTWAAATTLATSAPRALKGNGSGFAALWTDTSSTRGRVFASGVWGAVTQIDSTGGGSLSLERRGSGYVAAWTAHNQMRTADYGTTWATPQSLVTGLHEASAMDVRVAARGARALVTWQQFDGNADNTSWPVPYAAAFNGTSWTAPFQLDTIGGDPAQILFTSDTEVAVAWFSAHGYGRMVRKYSFTSGSWSALAAAVFAQNSFSMGFTFTGSEYLVAYDDTSGNCLVTASTDGLTWGTPANLGAGSAPTLVTSGGTTFLFRTSGTSVQALTYLGNGSWSQPASLGVSTGYATAGDGKGGVAVLMVSSSGIGARIFTGTAFSTLTSFGAGTGGTVTSDGTGYLFGWKTSSGMSVRPWSAGAFGATRTLASVVGGLSSNGAGFVAFTSSSSGPVAYSVSATASSTGGSLDTTAGIFSEAVAASTPGSANYAAAWSRMDSATAAQAIYAAGGL
ncbi:MAG TPA: Ig-like domain-containing protein [Polyangia bacterium]|nr:Ig-like domain-containing protein [Polyangia bacterium]